MKIIVKNLRTGKTHVKRLRKVKDLIFMVDSVPTTLKEMPKIGDEFENVCKSSYSIPTRYRMIGY